MKKTIYAIAALALLFTGCAKEINETFVPGDVVTVRAKVNDTYTKVAADNAGTFSWQAGDKITILNDAATPAPFEFITSTGMSDAPFTCTTFDGGLSSEAFYPASSNHKTGKFYLEPSFAWKEGETNMPMLGEVNTSTKAVSFTTTGAAIKLVCYNVPGTARKLVVSSDSKKLSGEFTPTGTPGAIVSEDSASDKTITITFDSPTSPMVFYIPVPTGNLGKLTFVMKDGSNAEVSPSQTTKQAITMARQHIVAAPVLNCSPYDLLLLETFNAPGDKTETVSAYNSAKAGQTVYSGAIINYSIGSNTNTKVYQNENEEGGTNQSNFAGGAEPGELFLAKKASSNNGEFIISGIPAKVSSSLKLTFKSNKNSTTYVDVTSDTGITLSAQQASETSPYTISYDITVSGSYASETFSLTFSNGSSSNTRIDDIIITTAQESFTAPTLTPDEVELVIDKDGGDDSTSFTYSNRIDETPVVAIVEAGASWLTAVITGTYPSYTLTVSAAKNTGEARSAKVTLRATGVSKEINVSQASSIVSTPDPIVIDYNLAGFPTSYGTANKFTAYTFGGYKYMIQQVYKNGEKMQWRAAGNSSGTGTIYNSTAMPAGITSIVIVFDASDGNKNHTVQIGDAENPSSATSITPSKSGTTYTFAGDGTSKYFVITNGSGAGYVSSITINFE